MKEGLSHVGIPPLTTRTSVVYRIRVLRPADHADQADPHILSNLSGKMTSSWLTRGLEGLLKLAQSVTYDVRVQLCLYSTKQ